MDFYYYKAEVVRVIDGDTIVCNIDLGFQEAVTAHMGTMSYLTGTKIEWDHENNKIV